MFLPDTDEASGHPSDATLLQFQQGNLVPEDWLEIQSHLDTCRRCQMRLETLMPPIAAQDAALIALARAFASQGVASAIPRVAPLPQSFPDFETISAYLDGTLSRSKAAKFESLMASLPALAQEVETLRHLKAEIQAARESQPEDISQRAQTVEPMPPMIVKIAEPTQASGIVWWRRWLWPLQSLGTTAVVAMLLVIVWQTQQEQQQIQRENQQTRVQFEAEKRNLETQQRRLQREAEANQKQSKVLQNQLRTTQSQLNSIRAQRDSLKTASDRQSRQIARLQAAPRTQAPTVSAPTVSAPTVSATPLPIAAPNRTKPLLNDGNAQIIRQGENYVRSETLSPEAVAALRDGTLPTSPEATALRSIATTSKGETRFEVISPVATRVRELRPQLLWKRVPGANSYMVTLRDETAGEFVFESLPSLTTALKVPQGLTRGNRYTWQVSALVNGKIIAEAPQNPEFTARFEVLSEAQNRVVEKQLLAAGDSLLKRSLVLARAGLQDEAKQSLDLLRKGGAKVP